MSTGPELRTSLRGPGVDHTALLGTGPGWLRLLNGAVGCWESPRSMTGGEGVRADESAGLPGKCPN